MCVAAVRWMAVRVDFLSALCFGVVVIAGIITSQDGGHITILLA